MQKRAVVFGARETTAQLYPGWDAFEFDQGHVTKNQSKCSFYWVLVSVDNNECYMYKLFAHKIV